MTKPAAVLFLLAQAALAPVLFGQAAPLRVFSTNGVKAAMVALQAQTERAAGRPLTIEYGSSAALKRKIEAGEAFDVAILTPETTADLVKAGKIAAGSATEVAHTGIGFGIRAGAPKADIGTPEAVKQMLLKAKSIAIVKEGASRATVDRMFERLGIAAAVASKTTLESGTEKAGESVARGRAEVEIIPLSEIPLVQGVEILGPLPGDLQNTLRFQASVGANAKDAAGARKVIQFLTSPGVAPTYKAKGLETK
jgi:molybdate transport system substrate-binding protein